MDQPPRALNSLRYLSKEPPVADSDLQISVNIDPRGASQGADQAKSAIASLVSQCQALGGAFGQLGKDLSSGLEGVKKLSGAIEALSKGAQQAKSASGSVRTLSEDISGLAGKAASGVPGLAGLASEITGGLSGAVGEGAAKLALLGEAASGVAGIAIAVGQAAFMAGNATLEWAQHAQTSTTATAQQKERASALVGAWNGLNDAAGKVSSVFSSIGASLASAFAPAVTAVIKLMTDLASRFADSYTGGGLLKTAVDLVSGAIDLCSQALAALIGGWKTGIDVASDYGKLVGDAVKAVMTIVQDLGAMLLDKLSPAFKFVQGVATAAWHGVQSGFDTLLKLIKIGYQDWQSANRPLVEAIQGIGKAFNVVETAVQQVMQSIIDKIEKFADAILGFLEKLPGVSAVFKQLRDDFAGLVKDTKSDLADLGVGAPGPAPKPSPSTPPPKPQPPVTTPTASPSAPAGAPHEGGGGQGCDAAAAGDCAAEKQAQQTNQTETGVAQRVALTAAGDEQITSSGKSVTSAAAQQQAEQVRAVDDANRQKVESTGRANRTISEANDRTLKQFESSMKSLVNTFASGLARMAEGAESFGKVMRQVGQKILDDIIRVIIGSVEKWAWGETEKLLASQRGQALLNALGLHDLAMAIHDDAAKLASHTTTEHGKTAATTQGVAARAMIEVSGFFARIISELASLLGIHIATENTMTAVTVGKAGARAGASGTASAAAAPWPLDLAAAGVGATLEGAALAYGSAAGGYDIPAGINPITQLHAEEMVLPARLANPMRDMLASFAGAGAGPAAGGHTFSFGDTHIHGAPNMSPGDFKQALAEHRANVAEAVASALHGGWRPNYRQPVGAL